MTDFPGTLVLPNPNAICSVGPNTLAWEHYLVANATATGGTWVTANRALFVPFWVEQPFVAKKIGVNVTATAAGNVDVGIYDLFGNRLVSAGSIAVGGVGLQTFDITDTLLVPGTYFMAMVVSTTTTVAFLRSSPTFMLAQISGCRQMASGGPPLPAVATFTTIQSGFLPIMVVSGQSVV